MMPRRSLSATEDPRPGPSSSPLSILALLLLSSLFAQPSLSQSSSAQEEYFREGEALFGSALVESASKFTQREDEVPGTMTVVTREEIRRYGFQTLGEVLNFASMGAFTIDDRFYDYVGMRGMFAFDDYNTRMVLLLNGHLLNEPFNNFAGVGREMLVPMDLVERVEILYGPWGVLYGSSNLYGMVNVVTRDAEALEGTAARASLGTQDTGEAVVSWAYSGPCAGGDAKLLISGGEYVSDGPRTSFPAFAQGPDDPWFGPITWGGGTVWGGKEKPGADRERSPFLFLDATVGEVRVSGRWGFREKHFPLAPYGSIFGDARSRVRDTRGFLVATWSHDLAEGHAVTVSLSHDRYRYEETEPYYDPEGFPGRVGYLWTLDADTRRTGGEIKYNATFTKGNLVAGGQYRRESIDMEQVGSDAWGIWPPEVWEARRVSQSVWAGYLLGQWSPRESLQLSAGANFVKYNYLDGVWLYRLAGVWKPREAWTIKVAAGKGFRAPSWYEYGYEDSLSSLSNPALGAEESPAAEASVTWSRSKRLHVTAVLFWQRNDDFIAPRTIGDYSQIRGGVVSPGADPDTYIGFTQYQNLGQVRTYGGGMSLKAGLGRGIRAHANLSLQSVRFKEGRMSGRPAGSPSINGNLGAGGRHGRFSWGAACFYIGPMKTSADHARPVRDVGGIWDWRLRGALERLWGRDLRLELLITNALGADQQNPISSIYVPDTVRRSHRKGTLSLIYRF